MLIIINYYKNNIIIIEFQEEKWNFKKKKNIWHVLVKKQYDFLLGTNDSMIISSKHYFDKEAWQVYL